MNSIIALRPGSGLNEAEARAYSLLASSYRQQALSGSILFASYFGFKLMKRLAVECHTICLGFAVMADLLFDRNPSHLCENVRSLINDFAICWLNPHFQFDSDLSTFRRP